MKIKLCFLAIILLPVLALSQSIPLTRMFSKGNKSIKINDSAYVIENDLRKTWLDKSGLAFSETGEELYFKHPTENIFQVWNVLSKLKTSELSYEEAGKSPKGRTIIAAFPNIDYTEENDANKVIWVSEDLNLIFDNQLNFTIANAANKKIATFKLDVQSDISDLKTKNRVIKKYGAINIHYQIYFHKKTNKIFIIAKTKRKFIPYGWGPYNGVFSFDLSNNTLNVLAENNSPVWVDTRLFIDKWFFFNDILVHDYVKKGKSLWQRHSLNNITKQTLEYATETRISGNDKREDGVAWRYQAVGTDREGNFYSNDPEYGAISIRFYNYEKTNNFKQFEIMVSTNKLNKISFQKESSPDKFILEEKHEEDRNVIAVAPSGKTFAFIDLNFLSGFGNYASIMLYNLDENDRVYSFNDQTKYEPYLAKNYFTNEESVELSKKWAQDIINAKQQRKQQFKPKLDSLNTLILANEKELVAIRKSDLDLFISKNYKTLLARNVWIGTQSYIPFSNASYDAYFGVTEELTFRESSLGITAIIKENLKVPISKKTDKYLLLYGEPGFNEGYVEGVSKGVRYIKSNCEASLVDWNGTSFRIQSEAFAYCQVKGQEILNEGDHFRIFGNKYFNHLMRARFVIYYNKEESRFYINTYGASGAQLLLACQISTQEYSLKKKIKLLEEELLSLNNFIENGN